MISQILYDKEISVTLYRDADYVDPSFTSHILKGYGQTQLNGTQMLWTDIGTKRYTTIDNYQFPLTVSMEFYEGKTRKVFTGYKKKNGKEVATFKSISLQKGGKYTLESVEEMVKGFRPDGSLFNTGDRIYTTKEKKTWVVFINDGTQGGGTTETVEITSLDIPATQQGLKADMTLEIKLLPGQNCYGAVLRIRNLNIDNINIRSWKRMVITAGYRTDGAKAVYTCPIFTSYIESPNPDGITVFEGLTVGVSESMLSNRYVELRFVQEKMTLRDLIISVSKGISPNLSYDLAISDDILNYTITVSKQTVYAQGAMAILNWLQNTTSKFVETISEKQGERISVFVQLIGNTLEVLAINGPNKVPERIEGIINLDRVSGAVFNGTALTVEAPWNPALQPGNLFYMPPEFINGSRLPNTLQSTDYRNEDNLYRALTMSIAFGSVDDTNKMTILAVPAQWAGELPTEKATEMRGDVYAQALSSNVVDPVSVQVGIADATSTTTKSSKATVESPTNKQLFDSEISQNLITTWGQWDTIKVVDGMCLSVLLEYYFLNYARGPHLVRGQGIRNEYHYDRGRAYYDNNKKALSHYQSTGCWANTLWWPLTMVGTYWKRYKDNKNQVPNNWDDVNINDPNLIHTGKYLYIPIFPGTWTEAEAKLRQVRELWRFAYLEYKAMHPEMCNAWRAMYYYMGGESDLG